MREYLITLVFFAVFCLAVVTIRQQAEGIQSGYRISEIRHHLVRLRDSNDRLRLSVLRLRSPGEIMQRARQLDLREPTLEIVSSTPSPGSAARNRGASGLLARAGVAGGDAR